jgi:3-isopropylmalate dehydrogenase
MGYAGDLWQRSFKQMAARYSRIQPSHLYIDALCLLMVRQPKDFQVIVTNNMFGDIVTDLAAALQGGLGMAASANVHPGRVGLFEPVHGSAPSLAGKGVANPLATILSAAMMLRYSLQQAEASSPDQLIKLAGLRGPGKSSLLRSAIACGTRSWPDTDFADLAVRAACRAARR